MARDNGPAVRGYGWRIARGRGHIHPGPPLVRGAHAPVHHGKEVRRHGPRLQPPLRPLGHGGGRRHGPCPQAGAGGAANHHVLHVAAPRRPACPLLGRPGARAVVLLRGLRLLRPPRRRQRWLLPPQGLRGGGLRDAHQPLPLQGPAYHPATCPDAGPSALPLREHGLDEDPARGAAPGAPQHRGGPGHGRRGLALPPDGAAAHALSLGRVLRPRGR
mmetsp:Transcript_82018/g.244650  ORF Transcript_82018/g.244650 Transcript_82018/m.244650 type:complete len:217 (+) Transcript_82018:1017-1667(+)